MTRCTGTDGCPVHPSVAVGPRDTPEAEMVDVVAAAINTTQIKPSELALGRDLRPVARRFLAALPSGWVPVDAERLATAMWKCGVQVDGGRTFTEAGNRVAQVGLARAILATMAPGRLLFGIDSTMTDEEMAEIAPLLPSSSPAERPSVVREKERTR